MAQVYTLNGQVKPLSTLDGSVLFRKMCDVGSLTEKQIAQRLMQHRLPNVVTIYDVKCGYIDMELLDVFYNDIKTQEADIRAAIDQLHSLRVVYVDIKYDNFGYSHADGCWKLFDFDGSGILKESVNEWALEPPEFHMYRHMSSRVQDERRPFEDIDALALDVVFRKS